MTTEYTDLLVADWQLATIDLKVIELLAGLLAVELSPGAQDAFNCLRADIAYARRELRMMENAK